MIRTVSTAERRDRLARRHLLAADSRVDDVAAVTDAVVALHSSDPVSVFLSALARLQSPTIAAVEDALYVHRTVLRHHAMRRTLWVGTPEVVRWAHAAATRKLALVEHRRTATMLVDNGIADAEAWLRAAKRDVLEVLADGPMTARELGLHVPALAHPIVLAPGKPYRSTIAAHSRVLLLLGFEGALVRTRPAGSWISGAYAWASTESWLCGGVDGHVEEREACRNMAEAWLRRFGPGTTVDLQWWTGWTATATRRALADVGALPVALEDGLGWVAPGDEDAVEAAGPWVALLPGLDPTVMGWKERSWYLPGASAAAFDSHGNAGPTVWVDGHVVGSWAQAPDGEIRVHWFLGVPARRRTQVQRRAEELAAWVGPTRFSARFPAAIQAALLQR